MYEDLEVIANLEFGRFADRVSEETRVKLQELMTWPRGGQVEAAKVRVYLDKAEEQCRAYLDIWVELIEARNGGHLTRQDVGFILSKVGRIADARANNLRSLPEVARMPSAAEEINSRMQGIKNTIGRDLEIRIRRQQALPKQERSDAHSSINLHVQNAANLNLGSQVGTIYASTSAISEQSSQHNELAAAIKALIESIVRTELLEDLQRREALQVIGEIAKQAECRPEERSIGTIKALVSGFPALIGLAADVTTLWDKYLPLFLSFFGLS